MSAFKKIVPENYFVWKYLSSTRLFGGSFQNIIYFKSCEQGILQKHFLDRLIVASQRTQAVNYSASLRIFTC